jgi:group I intron endonuclease
MGYIYKITNKLNKKCYIGQTINDVEKRWKYHRMSIGTQTGCPGIRRAFEKYGLENFKFEVLIICFDENMSNYEKEYIKKFDSYNNGYNMTHGGEEGGFFAGCKHTPENVQKIKERWAEYNANPENRKLRSDRMKEKYANPENRKEHGKIMKETYAKLKIEGKLTYTILPKSDDVKQKIRTGLLKYYANNANTNINTQLSSDAKKVRSQVMTKAIGRKVSQYSLTGDFIKSYDSIKIAAEETNGSRKSINSVVVGWSKTSGGFIWKYAD